MKTKKFSKKLSLNKTTIVNLYREQLNGVRGGVRETEHYNTCHCPGTIDCPSEFPLCDTQSTTCYPTCPTCFETCPSCNFPC